MKDVTTIEQYLDRLAEELIASPRRARRILAETQDHLATARQALVDGGMAPQQAEAAALRQFGSPATVARSFRRGTPLASLPFLESLATTLFGLAAVGFIAIGLSGVLALGMGAVAGKEYVAGDAPGVTYTSDRCEDFLRFHPEAGDCASAAVAHHYDEVLGYRFGAGLLGLLTLAAYFAARRLRHPSRMPPSFAPTIGAAAFGLAGIGLTGLATMQTIFGSTGGQELSGGVVALAVAAVFSLRLLPLLAPQVAD